MRPMILAKRLLAFAATCGACWPSLARADGTALRADLVEPKSIKLDGVPKEWPQALTPLSYTTKGEAGAPDLEARGVVAYDQNSLYVGADVTDDKLRPGGDFVSLTIGFPGGTTYEMKLFPGQPGRSPGVARGPDNKPIPGAKVVEAPRQGGWSLEASVPWSAMPQAKTVRVGMRAAMFVHDADDSNTIESIVGTGPSAAYASLPALVTESEQALGDGLLREKRLYAAPKYNLIADVVGDAMKERVLVFDRYLVVLGPTYRGGTQYYYGDLGVDVANGMLPSLELRDLTGDGLAEIILHKRIGTPGRWREVLQVLSFASSETPNPIFTHEVGIGNETGSILNDVKFVGDGPRAAIVIEPGVAKGLTQANYREPTETSYDPVLLPWGGIRSQTYKFQGGTFNLANEEKQKGAAVPSGQANAKTAAAPAPSQPTGVELSDKVFEQYKRDRGASGRPKFDVSADVGADRSPEHVVVADRDIVIFGKGFKSGTGYSYLTLAMFAAPSDINEVTARDLTGDGKAEILVRGIVHANAPREAGSGTVDREVVVILQVDGEVIRRIFAAELGRSMGTKRIIGAMRFVTAGKGSDIELAPDRAIEWTEKTYPFNQDTSAVGGYEPLLLPWGGNRAVRYRFTGSSFSR